MRIQKSVRHKVCADGSLMKEYRLDAPITRDFIEFLTNFGPVEFQPHLGPGFFHFEKPDCFSIKGLKGDTLIEVRFKREVMDITVDFLYSLLFYYRDGRPDMEVLHSREKALADRVRKHLYG